MKFQLCFYRSYFSYSWLHLEISHSKFGNYSKFWISVQCTRTPSSKTPFQRLSEYEWLCKKLSGLQAGCKSLFESEYSLIIYTNNPSRLSLQFCIRLLDLIQKGILHMRISRNWGKRNSISASWTWTLIFSWTNRAVSLNYREKGFQCYRLPADPDSINVAARHTLPWFPQKMAHSMIFCMPGKLESERKTW